MPNRLRQTNSRAGLKRRVDAAQNLEPAQSDTSLNLLQPTVAGIVPRFCASRRRLQNAFHRHKRIAKIFLRRAATIEMPSRPYRAPAHKHKQMWQVAASRQPPKMDRLPEQLRLARNSDLPTGLLLGRQWPFVSLDATHIRNSNKSRQEGKPIFTRKEIKTPAQVVLNLPPKWSFLAKFWVEAFVISDKSP